jgi:hypothetical protein
MELTLPVLLEILVLWSHSQRPAVTKMECDRIVKGMSIADVEKATRAKPLPMGIRCFGAKSAETWQGFDGAEIHIQFDKGLVKSVAWVPSSQPLLERYWRLVLCCPPPPRVMLGDNMLKNGRTEIR